MDTIKGFMDKKIDIGLRVAEERNRLGMSQAAFGGQGGVSKGTQLTYEKGTGAPNSDYLVAIASIGADVPYILTGHRSLLTKNTESSLCTEEKKPKDSVVLHPIVVWDNEDELDPDFYVFIPVLDIKLSAGNGNVIWEVSQKIQRQAFLRRWVERVGVNPSKAAIMTASGNSMEPRILDGDSLVVDYERTYINEGKIYALALQGEVFVKRIHKEIDGALRISSANADKHKYPDKLIPPDLVSQIQIIGRVMAVSGGV
ncbi:MAG: hypothetical protein K2Q15_05925 [Burkholderiales bacterium]|nr:hypothetical protein [Burkholderiales bacterium]